MMKAYVLISNDCPVAAVQADNADEAATKLGGEFKVLEGRFLGEIDFSYEKILENPNWIKEKEQGHATVFYRQTPCGPFRISFWKNRKGKIIGINNYFLQEIPLL